MLCREWTDAQIKTSETCNVAVMYASAYGNTASLAQAISRGVTKAGKILQVRHRPGTQKLSANLSFDYTRKHNYCAICIEQSQANLSLLNFLDLGIRSIP